jgi:hypothetical protein
MHLKGKYKDEYMVQYKRMGSGTLEGKEKFVFFKISKYPG